MKHGDFNQRNKEGEIGSLIIRSPTLLRKQVFRVYDPEMTPNDPE